MAETRFSSRRRWAITAGVMMGMFLAALEATVVGTAMPTVIASLGGLEHYGWVFSAYLVTSTVSVPIWGKLSDLYGRRLLFQIAIFVFLAGSILSGFSGSMFQLIVFRAVQGLGVGGLVPLAMTIIGDIYTIHERARMQAFFSGVWGLSSIVGPVVGGFITDQLSWRWVFYINLPFGIVAAAIIGAALREGRLRERPKIDYAGAATLTAAIVMLMLVLVNGNGLTTLVSTRNWILLAGAALTFALFVKIEKREREPIVPFDLFKNRVVTVSVIAGFLTGIAMFGAISFIPLFAQGARGATATEAGSLLTPLMLSWVVLSVVGGRLLLRVGCRSTVLAGCLLLTLGFSILSLVPRDVNERWLYAILIVIGSGLGLTMLTLLIAVQQSVTRETLGTATSLNQFSRSIGGAVGVAVMGAILSAGVASHLKEAAAQHVAGLTIQQAEKLAANPEALISASGSLSTEILTQLRIALFSALQNIFLLAAIACALSFLIVLRLPRKKAECPKEAGERMLMAELTTLDSENEPESVSVQD